MGPPHTKTPTQPLTSVELGPPRGLSGVNFGSMWGPSGIDLGSIWCRPKDHLEEAQGRCGGTVQECMGGSGVTC